jgi:hypothetical protein
MESVVTLGTDTEVSETTDPPFITPFAEELDIDIPDLLSPLGAAAMTEFITAEPPSDIKDFWFPVSFKITHLLLASVLKFAMCAVSSGEFHSTTTVPAFWLYPKSVTGMDAMSADLVAVEPLVGM